MNTKWRYEREKKRDKSECGYNEKQKKKRNNKKDCRDLQAEWMKLLGKAKGEVTKRISGTWRISRFVNFASKTYTNNVYWTRLFADSLQKSLHSFALLYGNLIMKNRKFIGF